MPRAPGVKPRPRGSGKRGSKPDLVLKEANKERASAVRQKHVSLKSSLTLKRQRETTGVKQPQETKNKAATSSGQQLKKTAKSSTETEVKGGAVVLQPRVEVPYMSSRARTPNSLGTKIEPVPASETGSSDSKAAQQKAGAKVTVIDEDYSYESYYSESVTAQAKPASVPKNTEMNLPMQRGTDTCHQNVLQITRTLSVEVCQRVSCGCNSIL